MFEIVLTLLTMALPAPAAPAVMLGVEQISGDASLARGDQIISLDAGSVLQQSDLVALGRDAQLGLKLDRYGEIELGSSARLQIERLPFSSYASERLTELQLQTGFMRLLWKYPGEAKGWPLRVTIGDDQLSLDSGEYFFERTREAHQFCVASGEAQLMGKDKPLALRGPACYQLVADQAPLKRAQGSLDFIVIRDARALPVPAATPEPAAEHWVTAVDEAAIEEIPRLSAPSVAVPPAVTAAGDWRLNITSESDPASAEAVAARLRSAGYQPEIEAAQVNGRRWYRVQIQHLATLELARDLAQHIEQNFGYRQTWVHKP